MIPGSVVEYQDGKSLALGFCLTDEQKGKLSILTSSGRRDSLLSKKIVFTHNSPLTASATPEEVHKLLREIESQLQLEAEKLALEELWELVCDEGDDKDWSLEELCAFLFAGGIGEREKSLLYRALATNRVYFWRKAERFRARTRQQVADAKTRSSSEARRELELAVLRQWIANAFAGKPGEFDREYVDFIDTWKARIRDAAIWGERSSHYGHVLRIFKDFPQNKSNPLFQFMLASGEWAEDENIELLANETHIEFSQQVLASAVEVAKRLEHLIADPSREDWSDWQSFTIDDPSTTEIDDAIAFRATEDGYELAIHIADAAAFLTPAIEPLEDEMKERATSIYLPDLKVRMIPKLLSDGALSLCQDVLRPAFSFFLRLDCQGRMLEQRILRTKIRVCQRLSYKEVDDMIAQGDPFWIKLGELARKMKSLREANGAFNLPFQHIEVRLEGDRIVLAKEERETPSQTIVGEAMIMANSVAANYMAANGLPAIYRVQKAPEPAIEERAAWLPHQLFEVRKSIPRSSYSIEPGSHFGLGLPRYLQITSPIRRYRDLVHQRQIGHHLECGEVLYDRSSIDEISTFTSGSVSAAEKMERSRRSYYLLKYLLAQRGRNIDAIVLAYSSERYTLQLCETLREVEVPRGTGELKALGEKVQVKLLSVFPRDGVIKVSQPL